MGVLDVKNFCGVGNVEKLCQSVALPHRIPWRTNTKRNTEWRTLMAALVLLQGQGSVAEGPSQWTQWQEHIWRDHQSTTSTVQSHITARSLQSAWHGNPFISWTSINITKKKTTTITPFVDGSSSHTLWISYFNARCWATQGHSDFLEAGVKG